MFLQQRHSTCDATGNSSYPASHPTSHAASPHPNTENELASSVTGISRQLLDTFAFSQVDQMVGDVAHMREYLTSKFPDPSERPLGPSAPTDRHRVADTVMMEYKGAIYGKRVLDCQQVILEYLLGKCLEQCRSCLAELQQTRDASRAADESIAYVVDYGRQREVVIDETSVNAESARLFSKVRQDLYQLTEELRELDDSRNLAMQFLTNPVSVLPLVKET